MDNPEADVKKNVDSQSETLSTDGGEERSAAQDTLVPSTEVALAGAVEIKAPTPAEESALLKKVAAQTTRESAAAAIRLAEARAKLEQLKADLDTAVSIDSLPSVLKEVAPVSPPAETEPPVGLPDPLTAAEQALAVAAKARGVPLELPSRVPPDRSDPFAAATRALETARLARGGVPKSLEDDPVRPSSRHRDPFKAAEAALERAAAVRAEVGVSPEQEERESAARAELARLRRVKPTSDDDSTAGDDSTLGRKKRDL